MPAGFLQQTCKCYLQEWDDERGRCTSDATYGTTIYVLEKATLGCKDLCSGIWGENGGGPDQVHVDHVLPAREIGGGPLHILPAKLAGQEPTNLVKLRKVLHRWNT